MPHSLIPRPKVPRYCQRIETSFAVAPSQGLVGAHLELLFGHHGDAPEVLPDLHHDQDVQAGLVIAHDHVGLVGVDVLPSRDVPLDPEDAPDRTDQVRREPGRLPGRGEVEEACNYRDRQRRRPSGTSFGLAYREG